MNYSSFAPACQADPQIQRRDDIDFDALNDNNLKALEALDAEARVDNKVKRTRVKSVYRDALFRPLFQAVAVLDDLRANGGTSVTYVTPSHPLYPVIHLTNSPTLPNVSSSYKPETLTDAEELRQARCWRDYAVILPGLREHVLPAAWRDLSDPARLEWFHHALRSLGHVHGFTLDLSRDIEAQVRTASSTAGWLSKRIARRLEAALGRHVDCWFALEVPSIIGCTCTASFSLRPKRLRRRGRRCAWLQASGTRFASTRPARRTNRAAFGRTTARRGGCSSGRDRSMGGSQESRGRSMAIGILRQSQFAGWRVSSISFGGSKSLS
ncbi:hypothetical protein [Mesorhizobium sp. M0800]|uniref:hypothetical protein n=1 Tax=Mesorhizobium sp. M0800 TaxID=2957000 RepID=UPI00333985F5